MKELCRNNRDIANTNREIQREKEQKGTRKKGEQFLIENKDKSCH